MAKTNEKEYYEQYNKTYEVRKYRDESLNYTDTQNIGDVLLLGNPTQTNLIEYGGLTYYTIAEIKEMISTLNKHNKNKLLTIRYIGPNKIPAILSAIELYTSQIEKQSLLTNQRNINLLTFDKSDKIEIVKELYSEIILYLIENGKEKLFWGKLTDAQKRLYISSTINNHNLDKLIKIRMTNNIANYLTLPEIKELNNGNMKALNKFL